VLCSVLQCVAVRCSAFHSIFNRCCAVCCSVLQCIAARCSAYHSVFNRSCAVCCSMLQSVAVRCSAYQSVLNRYCAVCCSVLQCVAVRSCYRVRIFFVISIHIRKWVCKAKREGRPSHVSLNNLHVHTSYPNMYIYIYGIDIIRIYVKMIHIIPKYVNIYIIDIIRIYVKVIWDRNGGPATVERGHIQSYAIYIYISFVLQMRCMPELGFANTDRTASHVLA